MGLNRTAMLLFLGLLAACSEAERTTLFEAQPSPRGDYTLEIYVIEPWLRHGPHRIAIELLQPESGGRQRLVDTTLAYDGVPFTKRNIGVRWTGERAAFVCLSATDRPDQGIQITLSPGVPARIETRRGC